MINYNDLAIRKAIIADADSIMSIIKNRCKWLDNNNIEQWNVTRTYEKDYYIKKIEEEQFYVVMNNEGIIRNIYDTI